MSRMDLEQVRRWRVSVAAIVVLGAACGFPAPPDTQPDGSLELPDGPVPDAGPTLDSEPALGPWGSPIRIEELSIGSPRSPGLSPDRLHVYFGVGDLYTASRASIEAAWPTPVLIEELNTSAGEADPHVSADGLTLWFGREQVATSTWDIYVSVRASVDHPWGEPLPVDELNTAADEGSPSVTANGLILVMHSTRQGDADVFLSSRASPGTPWTTPVPISEVNTSLAEVDAAISPDGLDLYVTSDRPDGHGQRDLYVATRGSISDSFGAAINIDELNSSFLEESTWVSEDSRVIFFARHEGGSFGIYRATR